MNNATHNVTIKKLADWGDEYRVPSPDGTEAGAYYTDDKEDAINTARVMHGDDIVILFRTVRDN